MYGLTSEGVGIAVRRAPGARHGLDGLRLALIHEGPQARRCTWPLTRC